MFTLITILSIWSGILGVVGIYYMYKLKNWGWVIVYTICYYTFWVFSIISYILYIYVHNCVQAGVWKSPGEWPGVIK